MTEPQRLRRLSNAALQAEYTALVSDPETSGRRYPHRREIQAREFIRIANNHPIRDMEFPDFSPEMDELRKVFYRLSDSDQFNVTHGSFKVENAEEYRRALAFFSHGYKYRKPTFEPRFLKEHPRWFHSDGERFVTDMHCGVTKPFPKGAYTEDPPCGVGHGPIVENGFPLGYSFGPVHPIMISQEMVDGKMEELVYLSSGQAVKKRYFDLLAFRFPGASFTASDFHAPIMCFVGAIVKGFIVPIKFRSPRNFYPQVPELTESENVETEEETPVLTETE